MQPQIKHIVVCSDRELLVLALRKITEDECECQTVSPVTAPFDFERIAAGTHPDIVILDTDAGVFPLMRQLQTEMPDVPIVVWERSGQTEPALNALHAGARGILLDICTAKDVSDCLNGAAQGRVWVPQSVTQAVLDYRQFRLSRRESQLLALVSQGLRNKEIAYALKISEGTVKVYFSRLFSKLGVSDRYELALLGLRHFSSMQPETAGTATQSESNSTEYPKSVFVNRPARKPAAVSQSWPEMRKVRSDTGVQARNA